MYCIFADSLFFFYNKIIPTGEVIVHVGLLPSYSLVTRARHKMPVVPVSTLHYVHSVLKNWMDFVASLRVETRACDINQSI